MKRRKLLIFGNSMLAKVMLFYFQRDSSYDVAGFTVDRKYISDAYFCGLPVFPFEEVQKTHPKTEFEIFVAIGPTKMNSLREEVYKRVKSKGYGCATYISTHAICDSPLGENCFVGDMSIINPFVKIGYNNFFFEKVFIANDSIVENNCYFSPLSTIGTFSEINSNCVLGTGSIIKTSVNIAEKTLIGASCYISRNSKVNGVYAQRSAEFIADNSNKINISL
jgi:sugar O-acyltransferase (sialic acid O-acetyltransferase NeuD family)